MLGKLLFDLNLDGVYIANCIAIGILQSKFLFFSSKSLYLNISKAYK